VLRVRRKRGSPDPVGALLLACKRRRGEEQQEGEGGPVEESGVCALLATVASKNEPVEKYVQEVITQGKAAQRLQPNFGSTKRIIQQLRSSKEVTRKANRYRVVASHRPDCAETLSCVTDGNVSVDDGSNSEASQTASGKESRAVDSSQCCGTFQLFDIVQEEDEVGGTDVAAANPQQKTDPDVIVCNAVEMIRERLTVSEDGKKEPCEKEDEYIYDIYYMETSAPGWIQNILSVQPYREEYELVDDDPGPEEIYEDEDDENDENNWRNDYPDEDDFLAEEDGDGEKESDETSSDEDQRYRRRTWNKYQQEVLQEFEYDEIEDFDSD
ncbi:S7A6O protein, partial [Rhinopomastus cyanomelas]|nr:S7A6O protein [Rhinopomastus cyanomelas]